MAGNPSVAPMSHKAHLIGILLLLACSSLPADEPPSPERVEVWHTFGVDTVEERLFIDALERFSAENPAVRVEAVTIPYLQNLQQFINAAQAGEAPDLIRLSATELGRIGHVSVEGFPLLEDLRPHLTPAQKARFVRSALAAMSYGATLYALPASRSCMTLLYNTELFDDAGQPYPNALWRTEDLLEAAAALTNGDIAGIALPVKWSYWFIPFIAAAGGALFDDAGNPTLNSAGTADAMRWVLDLERVHGVTGATNGIEAMSTRFQTGRAAMVIDGPWNWDRYVESGVSLGQSLLPYDGATGKRAAPMIGHFGWGVAKQSAAKVAAVKLALWLTSREVQLDAALGTYSLPTRVDLVDDPAITGHPVLGGFVEQLGFGVTVPTARATAMLFEQLDTALALTHDGALSADASLEAADRELARMLAW